jgi:hypothetical protein
MAAQQLALLLDLESLTLEPFASGDELKQVRWEIRWVGSMGRCVYLNSIVIDQKYQ